MRIPIFARNAKWPNIALQSAQTPRLLEDLRKRKTKQNKTKEQLSITKILTVEPAGFLMTASQTAGLNSVVRNSAGLSSAGLSSAGH